MNHSRPLSNFLLEVGNGVILSILFFMLISAVLYFVSKVRIVASVEEPNSMWEVATRVYAQTKASWAAAIFFLGLFARTGDVWWVRHLQNHGEPPDWFASWATPVLLVSIIPTVWGGICWMRAVLPLRFPPSAWVFITLISLAFGVYMAW